MIVQHYLMEGVKAHVLRQGERTSCDFKGLYLNPLVSSFCSCCQVEVQHLRPFSDVFLGYKPAKLRDRESEADALGRPSHQLLQLQNKPNVI